MSALSCINDISFSEQYPNLLICKKLWNIMPNIAVPLNINEFSKVKIHLSLYITPSLRLKTTSIM